MQYVISFLEGIITFLSPCLLPMLPIYISYFAGGGQRSMKKTLLGALCATGTCAITANPVNTMLYMGLIGFLISGLFTKGCNGGCNT